MAQRRRSSQSAKALAPRKGRPLGILETVLDVVQRFVGAVTAGLAGPIEALLADARAQAREAMREAVRSFALILLFVWGTLFALVGLALYLSSRVEALQGGLGFLVVGLGLVLLGLLVRAFRGPQA